MTMMKDSMIDQMYRDLGLTVPVIAFGRQIEKDLEERFRQIDTTAEYNQLKVIRAMQKNRVADRTSVV